MRHVKFIIIISLLFTSASVVAKTDMSREAIAARIKPIGQVNTDPKAAVTPQAAPTSQDGEPATEQASGEQIYNQFCGVCHNAGLAGAPRKGDKAAWAERAAKGMDVLLKNAINGINAMPAKGTCATCSEGDLRNAIEYMMPHKG